MSTLEILFVVVATWAAAATLLAIVMSVTINTHKRRHRRRHRAEDSDTPPRS